MTSAAHPRVLAYSFDGMGLGHLRRNLVLLDALAQRMPDAAVLTVTGSAAADRFPLPPGVDVLRLPGLRKTTLGTSQPSRLPLSAGDVRSVRSALLTAAVRSFRPDLVLVDFYPLGRDGELHEALLALRAVHPRAQLVLGLRDILDAPATVRAEWHDSGYFAAAAELYDAVMVYGDATVFNACREYDFPGDLAVKTVFTGYLTQATESIGEVHGAGPFADIVCTMGGGNDAAELARVFVEAVTPMIAAGRSAMLLTGPFMPAADVLRLRAAAPAGMAVVEFRPDAPALFRRAACVVTMAGYNTTCELLAAGVPTIFVPRTQPRQEQRIRAAVIGARTGWTLLLPTELTPALLGERIRDALTMPRGVRDPVDMGGAHRAGQVLANALTRAVAAPLAAAR
ncbi:MAG: glycosyltransferase family protein [Mycobacteriales bacterium]